MGGLDAKGWIEPCLWFRSCGSEVPLTRGFYRTLLGSKRGFDRTFGGSMEPF